MLTIIKLSSPSRQGIIFKVAEFSGSGMSRRWIARELNLTEGWVNSALERHKKRHPPATDRAPSQENTANRARHGAAPFGFEVLDCRLMENPREQRTLQRIIDHWNAGHGPAAIARELNRSKLKTRNGGAWDHSVVSGILLRAQAGDKAYAHFAPSLRPYRPRNSPKRSRSTVPNVRESKPKTMYNKEIEV